MTPEEIGGLATALGGTIAAILGALAILKRASAPGERSTRVLRRVLDWLEARAWPVAPFDRVIDHLPRSLRGDIYAALGGEYEEEEEG